MGKLVYSYKDSLMYKAKAAPTNNQNNEFIHHFSWAGRRSVVPRKDKLYHSEFNALLLFPPGLGAEHDTTWSVASFGSMGLAVLAVPSHSFLCTPSLFVM